MKKIALILGFIIPMLATAQLDRSIRPVAGDAPVINIKDSEVFTTTNGITVILSENHKVPRVTINLVMAAAPQLEGERAGLSDVAGSLIMSGTSNKTKDELDAEIDYIGADISADKNSISLSCLTKHMDKGLKLMTDILYNANFPQSEVDRIITQYESSLIAAKSDASTMAGNVLAKVNFPANHPFSEVMTEPSLANINRDAIVNYYKSTFTPQGSYLVMIGDIDRKKAEEIANAYFNSWSGAKPYKAELGNRNDNSGNRVLFVNKPGAVQSVVNISIPMDIEPGHPDYLKLNVLNSLLGGGVFGNRLMQNLREDKAYTYGCRSRISVDEHGSYFAAGGNFRNEVTDSAITQILFELDRIISDLVEEDEIAMTKSYMAGDFARSLERPSTVARFALSIIKNDLPKDYYQTYLQKLDEITREDLLTTAKKYLTADKCNIIVVGNDEVIDRLKVFDSDGKIEKMDAFGNPVQERLAADITADELLSKIVKVMADGSEGKALAKKLKKLKSVEEVTDINLPQIPFPLESVRVWGSPNIECSKVSGNGMAFQKSYFDGTSGASFDMQSGSKPMTDTEIAAKKKSTGLIPEMNYKTSGMAYELLGIEEVDGAMCYVLHLNDGESEIFDYYDKTTFLKKKTFSITDTEGETVERTILYDDYKVDNGFLFANTVTMVVGEMSMSGKVKSRTFNVKIDFSSYK